MSAYDPRLQLPHNIEAEQSLLGAILVNNDAFHLVSEDLREEHFYEPLHRQIFKLCGDVINAGKRANPVTLKTYLPADQKIGNHTAIEYLMVLVRSATTIVNVPDWAQLIEELSIRRDGIGKAQSLVDELHNVGIPLMRTFEEHSQAVMELEASATKEQDGDTLQTHMQRQSQHVADVYQHKKEAGINTGLPFLDCLTGPWFKGNLILIGGGTKMGKTALAMQCLSGLSEHNKILVFSYEMQGQQLAAREISKRANVSTHRQNTGRVSDSEYENIERSIDRPADGNITVISKSADLDTIERQIIRHKKLKQLDVVVVDHIGLIEPGKRNYGKPEWELGQIATRRLKQIATRQDVVMVGLAQLKKNSMHQSYTSNFSHTLKACYKRPRYTDLIGGVERDTDHVIIPFRPEALLKEVEPMSGTEDYMLWEQAVSEQRGRAQVILALSREQDWPLVEQVRWDGKKTEFSSLSDDRLV